MGAFAPMFFKKRPFDDSDPIAPDMGSGVPGGSLTSALSPAPPQPTLQGTQEYKDFSDVGAKLRTALQPNQVGTSRALLGALFARRNPMLGSVITGDFQRQRQIQPLEQQYKLLGDMITRNREMQTQDINNQKNQAETGYYNAHSQQLLNPPLKPKEEEWSIAPGVLGPNGEPVQIEKTSGQMRLSPLGGTSMKDVSSKPSEEDKSVSDFLGARGLPNTAANRDKARSSLKTRDRVPKDPELADLSKQLKEAQLEKLKEPSADEQRRADLARNMEENLNNLEDIAKRRPELFGPVAGRMTGLRQSAGSSDPDVAALKTIEEQTGLAMVGAHAMRNAQHAEKAAQSVTGANHTPASALLAPNGPLARARESLQTFKNDEVRRRNAIEGNAPASSGTYKRPSANVVVEQ